jgi:lysophospholipase L1-like esterase
MPLLNVTIKQKETRGGIAMVKTIVCFGDSNTHGYISKGYGRFTEKERWTCLLQEYLGDGYAIKEEGLSGRTTVFEDPIEEGLNALPYMYPCLMSHEPVDLLIIMLGSNDVKQRYAASPQNIAGGMERLIKKAKNTKEAFRDGKPNILLMVPPAMEEGYGTIYVNGEDGALCIQKSRALAALYEGVAKRQECHFLDAGAVEGVTMNKIDFMHISLDGHKKLAEKLAELIPTIV